MMSLLLVAIVVHVEVDVHQQMFAKNKVHLWNVSQQ
jgi:hypothetical protein